MTDKFTEEKIDKAIEFMVDNGDLEIMPLEEFMTSFEPYEIAKMVKLAGLSLDYNYIRVNTYYKDTQEADTSDELISDKEIEEALEQLQ